MGLGARHLFLVAIVSIFLISVRGQSCDEGFTNHNSECYKVAFMNTTWIRAKEFCNAMGARLMSIESLDEQLFISGHIESVNAAGFVTPNIYWIGGTDVVEFRIFRWVHNEASLTYTNWQTGEPNNFGGLEHCLQLSNGNTWNDNRCDRLNNFICETSVS